MYGGKGNKARRPTSTRLASWKAAARNPALRGLIQASVVSPSHPSTYKRTTFIHQALSQGAEQKRPQTPTTSTLDIVNIEHTLQADLTKHRGSKQGINLIHDAGPNPLGKKQKFMETTLSTFASGLHDAGCAVHVSIPKLLLLATSTRSEPKLSTHSRKPQRV